MIAPLMMLWFGCAQEPAAPAEAPAPAAAAAPVEPVAPARQGSPDHVPEGLNPVQNEMLLLNEAARDAVTAIANNDLDALSPLFHEVHKARDLTKTALDAGAYTPPRGGDLAAFEALDDAFHDELVKLLQAARRDDLPAATQQLGAVLQQCTACHQQYRFEAP